jgi:hypothetical protein
MRSLPATLLATLTACPSADKNWALVYLRSHLAAKAIARTWLLSAAVSLCGAMIGCTGQVAQAPFRIRPDTTNWGSLLGPFDGQVVDQGTGNPISGALVLGTWSYESENGPAVPVSAYSQSVITSSDGAYSLPVLPQVQRRSALLRRFTLVVYKAGYIGYRSDVRFDDRTPRADFAQLANKVRLDRLPAGESHAQHLVFLGGGQPLLRAAQAEVIQAALDLAERSPKLPTLKTEPAPAKPAVPPTLAAQLLSPADLEAMGRGEEKDYVGGPLAMNLPGEPPPGEYTGVHYQKKGQPESHDAALRVFRTASGAEAEAVFARLRAQLQSPQLRDAGGTSHLIKAPIERPAQPLLPEVPAKAPPLRDAGAAAHDVLPKAPPKAASAPLPPLRIDASLIAYDAKQRTYGVVVLVRQLGVVIELLCGADLCPGEEAAMKLLSRGLSRL